MDKIFLILDSNSILHRAFHALPLLTNKKGEPTNAVYGFLLIFFRAIKDLKPDYIVSCFDFPAPTFRHKEFKNYKIQRPPTPKELSLQIPKIKKVLESFNIVILEKEGYEADDLVGSLCKKFEDIFKIILSSDTDLFQLIDKNTNIYFVRNGFKNSILYDEKKFKEEFNFSPQQFIDFKAIKGDPSDNIPGVKGIGKKTAAHLLEQFQNLENLYFEIENKNCKIEEKLKNILLSQKDLAILSYSLVKLDKNVKIDNRMEDFSFPNFNPEKVKKTLNELGFKSLVKRVDEILKIYENKEKGNLTLF
ncbi:MAG: 5'-3' exonuclease [Minisyncoccia bacterium]